MGANKLVYALGNYGAGNLGDEAIFQGLLYHNKNVCQIYINVPTYSNAIEIGEILRFGFPSLGKLIIGGGGLFCKQFVDTLNLIAEKAIEQDMSIEIRRVGVEGIDNAYLDGVIALCDKCGTITVRSIASKVKLATLGINNVQVEKDFSYYIKPDIDGAKKLFPSFDRDLCIIGIVTAGGNDNGFVMEVVRELLETEEYNVLHIPHSRHYVNWHENEVITGELIWSGCEKFDRLKYYKALPFPTTPQILLGIYGLIDKIVGYRYHSFIFAEMMNTPLFGMPHGDKAVAYFNEHPEMKSSLDYDDDIFLPVMEFCFPSYQRWHRDNEIMKQQDLLNNRVGAA